MHPPTHWQTTKRFSLVGRFDLNQRVHFAICDRPHCQHRSEDLSLIGTRCSRRGPMLQRDNAQCAGTYVGARVEGWD